MSVFIIAEAGVNHDGDERSALDLIDVAADCGADAVKFQTFSAEKLVTRGAAKAEYQAQQTGPGDQFGMLKSLELSAEAHRSVEERCRLRGIEFMSTPFDEEAARFLIGLGMRRVKVPSGEITNEPFLAFLAATGLPLILSTGMADLEEIARAVAVVDEARRSAGVASTPGDLTVLHCTSNYPAAHADLNLRALHTIADATRLPVGYSDHSLGLSASLAAVALGAQIIEKHFTLDRSRPGPDHAASLDPQGLADLVRGIREVEASLGSAEKAPRPSELPVRALVRRSVTLARALPAGAVLRAEDLVLLRPGTGIPPRRMPEVLGRALRRAMSAGTTIGWDDLG